MTSLRFVVPEVLLSQVIPSGEVRIPRPIATKMLFAYISPERSVVIPEVLEVQVVPSEELRMVPACPTITNVPFP